MGLRKNLSKFLFTKSFGISCAAEYNCCIWLNDLLLIYFLNNRIVQHFKEFFDAVRNQNWILNIIW